MSTATNGGAEPDHARRKLTSGQRRLEWIAAIVDSPRYSRLFCRFVAALAWRFTDRKTAETFTGVEKMAAHIGTDPRTILKFLAQLRADGFIERTRSAAPMRPAKYRLTFPTSTQPQPRPAVQPRKTVLTPRAAAMKPTARSTAAAKPEPAVIVGGMDDDMAF